MLVANVERLYLCRNRALERTNVFEPSFHGCRRSEGLLVLLRARQARSCACWVVVRCRWTRAFVRHSARFCTNTSDRERGSSRLTQHDSIGSQSENCLEMISEVGIPRVASEGLKTAEGSPLRQQRQLYRARSNHRSLTRCDSNGRGCNNVGVIRDAIAFRGWRLESTWL